MAGQKRFDFESLNFDRMIGGEETQRLTQRPIRLSKRRAHETNGLIEIERTDHGLHRTDRTGRHRQRSYAYGEQGQRLDGTPRHLAAHGNIDTRGTHLIHYKM